MVNSQEAEDLTLAAMTTLRQLDFGGFDSIVDGLPKKPDPPEEEQKESENPEDKPTESNSTEEKPLEPDNNEESPTESDKAQEETKKIDDVEEKPMELEDDDDWRIAMMSLVVPWANQLVDQLMYIYRLIHWIVCSQWWWFT